MLCVGDNQALNVGVQKHAGPLTDIVSKVLEQPLLKMSAGLACVWIKFQCKVFL